MPDLDILELRRLARLKKNERDERLRVLHEKAVSALLSPSGGSDVLARALAQVGKWEVGHLCNQHYILAWRNILSMPATAMRLAMLRDDVEGVALRQNSPFGFLAGEEAR